MRNYNGLDPADVSVTNFDNDSAGVTVSAISGDTDEAGTTATFTVVLTSQPTAPVTIELTSGDTTEGTPGRPALTFNGANWNVAQTVTVTGVDDALVDGDITYTVSLDAATSTDANYNGLDPADVSVTNIDDDTRRGDGFGHQRRHRRGRHHGHLHRGARQPAERRRHHLDLTSGDTTEGTALARPPDLYRRQLERGPDRDRHRRGRRPGRRRYHLHGHPRPRPPAPIPTTTASTRPM